jgi:hypothetical protein
MRLGVTSSSVALRVDRVAFLTRVLAREAFLFLYSSALFLVGLLRCGLVDLGLLVLCDARITQRLPRGQHLAVILVRSTDELAATRADQIIVVVPVGRVTQQVRNVFSLLESLRFYVEPYFT